jgi:acyl-coenzyme A thioesterase PaaI-like protein
VNRWTSPFSDLTQGRLVNHYLRLSRHERPSETGPYIEGRAPVDANLRGSDGRGMRVGPLLALVDSIGGFTSGLAVLPQWIVSTSIHLQVAGLDHVGPLRLDASVLRRGSAAVVTSVVVADEGAAGAHVAHGLVTCAVLDPPETPQFERPIRVDEAPEPDPDAVESLDAFFRIAPGDGTTTTRLELADHLRNPWGILHGGATSVLLDVAAVRPAALDAGATGDTVVHFLSPVRVGPVEARCRVVGDRPDGRLVRVAVHDTGNADRLCVLASVVVRRGERN